MVEASGEPQARAMVASRVPNLPPHLSHMEGTQGKTTYATRAETSKSQWCLDSGATHHMCPTFEMMYDYEPSLSTVEVGNGQFITRYGIGK